VPATKSQCRLQIRVDFDSGPLAGMLKATGAVQVAANAAN
jgi:hypothetical protein